ncbi:MAG: glycosyltransferase, partial [Sulfurifustaceae bacterium]
PPHDPDALAARIAEIFRDADAARRMGVAGRERALRHFTWSQVAERMEAVYARVMAGESQRVTAG